MGPKRELKRALESFWKGTSSECLLLEEAAKLRNDAWKMQKDLGLSEIPCNDYSFYDHVLDTACLVGAVPQRFAQMVPKDGKIDLTTYFAMARGYQGTTPAGLKVDEPALEMMKWFDTNYHYMVPELTVGMKFRVGTDKPLNSLAEAKKIGANGVRVVLLGPVSFLLLSKWASSVEDKSTSRLSLLPALLDTYVDIVKQLVEMGTDSIQFDEPCTVMDLPLDADKAAFTSALTTAYAKISAAVNGKAAIMFTTYFGQIHEDLVDCIVGLPVQVLHLDFTRSQESSCLEIIKKFVAKDSSRKISAGVVNGRNVWKVDAQQALATLTRVKDVAKNVIVSTSCSLLHCPVSLDLEVNLDPEVKSWLAFAKEKVNEVAMLATLLHASETSDVRTDPWLVANVKAITARKNSPRTKDTSVRARMTKINDAGMKTRTSPVEERMEIQRYLGLPLFPTTTIGSFPQTAEIRKLRASFKKGEITEETYRSTLNEMMRACLKRQEELGLDVLVHGEYERNDMVEFFGQKLHGFVFTEYGWVQSYGSRCVKPPIIFGDVYRSGPMTLDYAKDALTMTSKPVKGMLTGPVTILQWSFVRDDQSRGETCTQIALAIRDEVDDLQEAGVRIIQVDEPAIREGLPLRKAQYGEYLQWAVDAFRLSTSVAKDETQIHSHFCYSDFGTVLKAIMDLDVDVLSIESARSDLKLLSGFSQFNRSCQIGPGTWDIHSPRVPSAEEMMHRVEKMMQYLQPQQLWINPDCGLKTRGWDETEKSIANLVQVSHALRSQYQKA